MVLRYFVKNLMQWICLRPPSVLSVSYNGNKEGLRKAEVLFSVEEDDSLRRLCCI
jgi:hypothetical protein